MATHFNKALVTGGAGFIGSHLVQELVGQGCKVSVIDNLTTGHVENLDDVRAKITFIEGDITDQAVLAHAMDACDIVFHQAAVVSVTQTVEDPIGSTRVNDLGTLNVLETARQKSIRRVVLASSSAVYGDDPKLPKTENMETKPLSPYAVQKLTNEHYADLYHGLYGLETVCLRYFNVFGPRQDPSSPYSGVISIFMSRAVDGQPPVIYGDGRQTRDFVYVLDVVRANMQAAMRRQAAGQVYNIGTASSMPINRLWESIARLAGITITPQYEAPRTGDIVHSCSAIRKAADHLGFKPAVLFEDGIKETFSWYQQKRK